MINKLNNVENKELVKPVENDPPNSEPVPVKPTDRDPAPIKKSPKD